MQEDPGVSVDVSLAEASWGSSCVPRVTLGAGGGVGDTEKWTERRGVVPAFQEAVLLLRLTLSAVVGVLQTNSVWL